MEPQMSPANLCGDPLPSSKQDAGTRAKHWLAAYGERVPAEIDPDAHGSVVELLEGAM